MACDDLALVRLRREHADFVRALFADPRVGDRFIDGTPLATERGALAFAGTSPKLAGQHRFAVFREAAGGADPDEPADAPVGLGMVGGDVARGYATIGYAVVPTDWGRGNGTSIARLLCVVAFDQLAAPEVQASVKPANAGSLRVLEKLGFGHVGERERDGPGGERVGVSRYALPRERWQAAQSAVPAP